MQTHVEESDQQGSQKRSHFRRLKADLLLVHAPAFFDFRHRRDIYFPFLGTSGDVPITPLYEYFPIGFKNLQSFLEERGHSVAIANLSTILLRYPEVDVEALIRAVDARLIGIDLHWMVHVQGSLALAKLFKRLRSDIPIIFGGISSTYYADELIQYPFIDMVMRGYDTLQPMDLLLSALKQGVEPLSVPNLLWKTPDGAIRRNSFIYKPNVYGVACDWASLNHRKAGPLSISEFLSTQNAGCAYNCGWCGGSREAFRRVFEVKGAMVRKSPSEVRREFDSLKNIAGYHFYSVGSYNESRAGMERFLELVGMSTIRSVSYEQFHLTPEPILKRMVEANKRTSITLSPESHDLRISKLAGRGVYTNDQLERWIEKALELGIYNIDIWYFIGMPEQDRKSVEQTVEYCQRLLQLFRGKQVNPMLCPMIPFLDPASTFFEHPQRHGYRVFYRTVEEHRRAMNRASIINRINYETKWLRREDLVYTGFSAVRSLMQAKVENNFLRARWVNAYNAKIDDALSMIKAVHQADCILDPKERSLELEKLGDEIERRNEMIFYSGVANQAFPVNRAIGGRWFDEMGWTPDDFESFTATQLTPEASSRRETA